MESDREQSRIELEIELEAVVGYSQPAWACKDQRISNLFRLRFPWE
jgi:hypothetical protein